MSSVNGRTWSPYQQAIFDWVHTGRGNAIVNARAGSGKTTTLIEAARRTGSDDVVLLAFNKHIADEINARMGRPIARTIHSLGFEALRRSLDVRVHLDEHKYRDLAKAQARQLLFDGYVESADVSETATRLRDMADLARVTLTPRDNDAFFAMARHYGATDVDEVDFNCVYEMIEAGDVLANSGKVDYTDMLYLPADRGLSVLRFGWVLVDECQDLSAAQLEIVMAARAPGARVLAVGDPNQAINGFAGARNDSFEVIRERLGAQEFPLSICYRCSRAVVRHAKRIVPAIEHAADAGTGAITTIAPDKFSESVAAGDMVLCRLTAPLIRECIALIGAGVPARVRGRDIGKSLSALVRRATKPGLLDGSFPVTMEAFLAQQLAGLSGRSDSEEAIQSIRDRVDAVVAINAWRPFTTLDDFCTAIEELFSDGRPAVLLSTVHRAKGLEAKRVFIIEPDKLPLEWKGQLPWERQQEKNLQYVAITRAMHDLIYVGGESQQLGLDKAAPAFAGAAQ